MLSNLHFERVEKHDFVLRNLPNRVHPKWVGGTIPFISFLGVGVKHGVFGAQNFLIVQLSLKSKIFFNDRGLLTCKIYFFFKMSDSQIRNFIIISDTIEQTRVSLYNFRHIEINLNNSRHVWARLKSLD